MLKLFNRKYKIFKKKIRDVEVSIWEYEFKIAKSRQVREGVRQDRDRALESVKRIEVAVEGTKDAVLIETMNADKAKHLDNAKRYEAQMKMIDDQINGLPASEGNPGQEGILGIIASLTELKKMYEDYAKSI